VVSIDFFFYDYIKKKPYYGTFFTSTTFEMLRNYIISEFSFCSLAHNR